MGSTSKAQILGGQVYTVGKGEDFGQVGMGSAQSITYPIPIIGLEYEKIIAIASSSLHTLALNEKGEIWSWGCNQFGALGRSGEETIPKLINHTSVWHIKFTKIACKNSISMAISSKGLLYTWGTFRSNNNEIFGYLPDTEIQAYPRIVNDLAKLNIIDIGASFYHCLALSNDGKVYSWGFPGFHLLGRVTEDNSGGIVPSCIPDLKDIVSITCGSYNSFAVNKRGELFTWGWNHYQQCGIVDKVSGILPNDIICQPTMVPYFKAKQQDRLIIQPEKMGDFTDQIDNSEHDEPIDTLPVGNTIVTGTKIKSVSAGEFHTVVLMDDNTLIMFGRCDEGQLGVILYPNYNYVGAMKLNNLSKVIYAIGYPLENLWHCKQEIIKVVCGSNHSLILTSDGNVYGFGHSGDCQLGLFTHEIMPLPTLIQSIQGKRVINASAGDRFTMFIVA